MLYSPSSTLSQTSLASSTSANKSELGSELPIISASPQEPSASLFRAPSMGVSPAVESGTHSVDDIFTRAKSHPFYQELLADTGAFVDCPPTGKNDLRPRIAEGLKKGLFKGASVYWSPSGGSTGEVPLAQRFFPCDVAENKAMRAALAEKLRAWGMFNKETTCLNIFPSAPFYQSLSLVNDLGERAGATMIPAGGSASVDDMIDAIVAFGINTIAGMPGQVIELAGEINRRGIKTDIRVVVTACSKLHAGQMQKIEEDVGNTLIFNELYGSAETGVWAFKPSALSGTRDLIVDTDIAYPEVVDVDEDGVGDILLTNLMRYTHPVLRYETGDRGRIHRETVGGSTVTCLEFHGRHQRSFQYSGDTVELEEFDKVLGNRVGEYQVTIWQEDGRDCVCVDVANPASGQDASRLQEALEDAVGFEVELRVMHSNNLVRDRLSRKLKAVVDLR